LTTVLGITFVLLTEVSDARTYRPPQAAFVERVRAGLAGTRTREKGSGVDELDSAETGGLNHSVLEGVAGSAWATTDGDDRFDKPPAQAQTRGRLVGVRQSASEKGAARCAVLISRRALAAPRPTRERPDLHLTAPSVWPAPDGPGGPAPKRHGRNPSRSPRLTKGAQHDAPTYRRPGPRGSQPGLWPAVCLSMREAWRTVRATLKALRHHAPEAHARCGRL
jgi:hypothetical protein